MAREAEVAMLFKASLGYSAKPCLTTKQPQNATVGVERPEAYLRAEGSGSHAARPC